MTRFPAKLEDKHTREGKHRGKLVDAFVCLDVPAGLIAETILNWKPLWDAGLERRHRLGMPPLENEHWDWLGKADWLSLVAYRSLGVECEGMMQGLMLVVTDGYYSRTEPDLGKPLIYVDYVQTAPWNDEDLVDRPRLGAVGTHLLDGAVKLSVDLEYAGRIGLHSLQRSEGFYRRLGFAPVEIERRDRHARGLWYFELTRQRADEFLHARRTS
jgi:hypothetical protein